MALISLTQIIDHLNALQRMKELQADEAKGKMLRLSIEAGGCSGFQYNFLLDDKTDADDRFSVNFILSGILLISCLSGSK